MAFPYLDELERIDFPDPFDTAPDGLLVQGGNLSPGVLLSAYESGIFPWFNPGDPVLWWSPDPRFLLEPENLHCPRSLKKQLKKEPFTYSLDRCFIEVINHCAALPRLGQDGTWITDDMIRAYIEMHKLGFAHSLEVWQDEKLVGGLYGLSLGKAFFGESMFSFTTGASKAAFLVLTRSLEALGFNFIDCQIHTPHLESLGARNIPKDQFFQKLDRAREGQTLKGDWGSLVDLQPPWEFSL